MTSAAFVALVAIAMFSSACRGDDYDVYFFHGVEGVITLRGDVAGEFVPSSGSVAAGSGSYAAADSRVSLNFGFAQGSLHASVPDADAPGTYQLGGVVLLFDAAEAEDYECRIGCDDCHLTLVEVGTTAIVGDLTCEGLLGCLETGAPCDLNVAPRVNVSASFELSQPSRGLQDY